MNGDDRPSGVPDELRVWFATAQAAGLLGPGPIDDHIEHAGRFREALGTDFGGDALDLGTGAGVPGLVLATWWPRSRWQLVDGKQKRIAMLGPAIGALGLEDRVHLRGDRAEALAHDPAWRESFDLVVARSFGPPAVVAECGAAFLRLGGRLAVSEPPTPIEGTSGSEVPRPGSRWSGAPVDQLGLTVGRCVSSIQILDKTGLTPEKYPRRVGLPSKRPLF